MNYADIHHEAMMAGQRAASAVTPEPMVLVNHRTGYVYEVAQGACGFAEVRVKGNTGFGRWAKQSGWRRTEYCMGGYRNPGYSMSIHLYGQSLELKEAFALAYAEKARELGAPVFAFSRMD
jgi:hypothetical protein